MTPDTTPYAVVEIRGLPFLLPVAAGAGDES